MLSLNQGNGLWEPRGPSSLWVHFLLLIDGFCLVAKDEVREWLCDKIRLEVNVDD